MTATTPVRRGRRLPPHLYALPKTLPPRPTRHPDPGRLVRRTPWHPDHVNRLNRDTPSDEPPPEAACPIHPAVALHATPDGWICARKGCKFVQPWVYA